MEKKIKRMVETIVFLRKFCKFLMLLVLILGIALGTVSYKLANAKETSDTVQIAKIVLKDEIKEEKTLTDFTEPMFTIINDKKFNDAAKLPPLPKVK